MACVVDTSAWVEYLRATGSPVHEALRSLTEDPPSVVVPELVVMELLAGASDSGHAKRLRRLLHSFEVVPLAPIADTERAAALQRRCRTTGQTVRSMVDCMIGAIAERLSLPVLHLDRDFEVLARHTPVRTVQMR